MTAVDTLLFGLCLNITCVAESEVSHYEYGFADPAEFESVAEEKIKNAAFNITTMENYPLSWTTVENGTRVGHGLAFLILDFIREKYKFNYTIVMPDENVIGNNNTGVLGALISKKADIAVAFLPMLSYLNSVGLHYSKFLDMGEWIVLMKRPSESAKGSGLLAPFDFIVWILILVSFLITGPTIYWIIVFRTKLCPSDKKNTIYPLSGIVWFVYGALLKQGSTYNPVIDSTRLLFATWWIFITVLTAFYTANLTAFLTLSEFTLPIEKPEDLKSPKYRWVTQRGQAIQEIINEPDSELIFLRGSKRGVFADEDDVSIVENYVSKGFMYIRDKPGVDHFMYRDYLNKTARGMPEKQKCNLVLTRWPVVQRTRAFIYGPDFEYAGLFNKILEKLVEAGVVKHELQEDLPKVTICPEDLGEKGRQLHNGDLFMTYMVIVAGYIISGICFLAEKIYRKFKERKTVTDVGTKDYYSTYEKALQTPPPSYNAIYPSFGKTTEGKMKIINGRSYWVLRSIDGDTRLVPVRTPSALLFQYTS